MLSTSGTIQTHLWCARDGITVELDTVSEDWAPAPGVEVYAPAAPWHKMGCIANLSDVPQYGSTVEVVCPVKGQLVRRKSITTGPASRMINFTLNDLDRYWLTLQSMTDDFGPTEDASLTGISSSETYTPGSLGARPLTGWFYFVQYTARDEILRHEMLRGELRMSSGGVSYGGQQLVTPQFALTILDNTLNTGTVYGTTD